MVARLPSSRQTCAPQILAATSRSKPAQRSAASMSWSKTPATRWRSKIITTLLFLFCFFWLFCFFFFFFILFFFFIHFFSFFIIFFFFFFFFFFREQLTRSFLVNIDAVFH